ncbi:GntR family transcriptional regulator [Streptomyces pacificus]|nr:GntR family transcriptional regulator [Streptomyces pacificus]
MPSQGPVSSHRPAPVLAGRPAPGLRRSPATGAPPGQGPVPVPGQARDGRASGDRPSSGEWGSGRGEGPGRGASGTDGPVPRRRDERADAAFAARVRGEHTHGETPAPGPVVRRHSVRGQVLDALRTALVSGELCPGEIYSAPALGERLGVSATPVREAMQQLALEGAVETVPNRGFRVVERTARELAELAEVRALIEVPVMLRLARTVPPERWAELVPLAEATAAAAQTGDRAGYAESDRAFHGAVLSLAGNGQLVAVADDLHRRSQWPLVRSPAPRRAELVADAAEHAALLEALMGQDLSVVASLVRKHFNGAMR